MAGPADGSNQGVRRSPHLFPTEAGDDSGATPQPRSPRSSTRPREGFANLSRDQSTTYPVIATTGSVALALPRGSAVAFGAETRPEHASLAPLFTARAQVLGGENEDRQRPLDHDAFGTRSSSCVQVVTRRELQRRCDSEKKSAMTKLNHCSDHARHQQVDVVAGRRTSHRDADRVGGEFQRADRQQDR